MNHEGKNEFSDANIRRFLLAQLDPDEQSKFESSLFTDEQFEQRVRFAEYELADDYAFQRLNRSERTLFEQNFVVSSHRKNQLTVSNVLRDRFDSAGMPHARSTTSLLAERLESLFNLRQSPWKIAFAALLFLLVLGTGWLAIKKEPQIKEAIAKRITGKRAAPKSSPVESNHPINSSIPGHENRPSPLPQHEQTVQGPVIVAVTPELARENAPSIVLPQAGDAVVRFALPLTNSQSNEYRVTVRAAQGEAVFAGVASFNSFSNTVSFEIPARLLKQGDYQVELIDNHSNAGAATYYFRVQ